MSGSSSKLSIDTEQTPLMAKDAQDNHEEVVSVDKDPEASPRSLHADRAASIIGDQRIELTEEEVPFRSLLPDYTIS